MKRERTTRPPHLEQQQHRLEPLLGTHGLQDVHGAFALQLLGLGLFGLRGGGGGGLKRKKNMTKKGETPPTLSLALTSSPTPGTYLRRGEKSARKLMK